MSISDRCRSNLRALESSLRDDHSKSESIIRPACSDLFLSNEKKPTPLEELETLNAFATYFTSDDDLKSKLFYHLFPLERDIAEENLRFLTKLSSLAICIGLPVILDLAALWLKIRVAQLYASLGPPSIGHSVYRMVAYFTTNITTDMLSIPGLPGSTHPINGCLADADPAEHPLFNLPYNSPFFTDAYLSAVTVIYGTPFSLVSFLTSNQSMLPISPPPSPIVRCIVHWLQTSRIHPKSHHHSTSSHTASWTTVDWLFYLRRFKSSFQTYSYLDQIIAGYPPIPVSLIWWTVFIPLNPSKFLTKPDSKVKDSKALCSALGDLHFELLLCSLDQTGLGSAPGGHRHSGTVSSSGANASSNTFVNWSLSCFRKDQPTRDLHCLELLIQCIMEHCIKRCATDPALSASSGMTEQRKVLDSTHELAVTRAIEFLQVAWVNGRFRNLNSDGFSKLISPLEGHQLVDLLLARLRR